MCHGVELMNKWIVGYIVGWILVLSAFAVFAQVGPAPGIQLQDEGLGLGRIQILNCVGAGVVCTKSGATGTATISGGGSGSANVVQVSVSLGTGNGLFYSATVIGQAWVTGTSIIACSPFGTTADGQTPETVTVAAVIPTVANLVNGVGFDLMIYTPYGASGTYRFNCTGA